MVGGRTVRRGGLRGRDRTPVALRLVSTADPTIAALAELRQARRRKRIANIHWVDAMYQVYVVAILGLVVLVLLSGAAGGTQLDKAGLADLLNWSHLVDSGIVLCKDGSLLAGWFYRAPDIASSTDNERNWLSGRVNAALARLGAGWASWIDTVRLPASSYPTAKLSHFPDPISRLVDAERRAQFLREGAHYEGEYAIVVQFTPPLRRSSSGVSASIRSANPITAPLPPVLAPPCHPG